jgi:hypothetical protein
MNNTIFNGITHGREEHIDSRLLNAQSRVLRKMAANLEDNSRRYHFNSFSAALTDKFKDRQSDLFDWTKLGMDCGALFMSAPAITIMLGPIGKPKKPRKIAERKGPKQRHEEVRPEELTQTAEDDDEATNERIQTQRDHIQNLCYPEFKPTKKNELPPANTICNQFDLLYNLLDPADAVQTVENFFDFAFLIKEKKVTQKIDENGMPISLLIADGLQNADRKQMVLSMGMKDLKKLSKLVAGKSVADGLNSACPLHRNDLLYAAKNAHEQVMHKYFGIYMH